MASKKAEMLAANLQSNMAANEDGNKDPDLDLGRMHKMLPLSLITPGKYQPRTLFEQEKLEALAKTIRDHGLIEPIVVRPTANGKHEIIAGERRYRAAALAGQKSIEVLVIHKSDEEVSMLALIENIQRVDLTDYEIRKAMRVFEHRFSTKKALAEEIGIIRQHITMLEAFDDLPRCITDRLDEDPSLVSRTLAPQLKQIALDYSDDDGLHGAFAEMMDLLASASLSAKDAPAFMRRKLKKKKDTTSDEGPIVIADKSGKEVINIVRSAKMTSIRAKNAALSVAKHQRLVAFLNLLINEED